MSNSPPSPGPDLFFAGGECLTRFGVWVRRTDMDLEAATRETFTRDSDAEALGRDGILRPWQPDTARVEWLNEVDLDVTRNVLPASDILGTGWTSNRLTRSHASLVVAPDGGTGEVDAMTETTETGEHFISQQVAKSAAIKTYSVSVFVRPKERNGVALDLSTFSGGDGARVTFDDIRGLAPGVLSTFGAGWSGSSPVIERNGFGFFRVSFVVTSDATEELRFNIVLTDGTTPIYTGDGVSGLDVWASQVEETDAPGSVQIIPRDTDHKFPTLFLEEDGANGWTESENIPAAVWTKSGATAAINQTTSPDGFLTADKLVEDATAATAHQLLRAFPTITPNVDQSFSLYVKQAGRAEINFNFDRLDASVVSVWFDLVTGTVGTESNGTGRIRALDDGWFRVQVNWNPLSGGGSTTPTIAMRMGDGGENASYDGDGTSGLFIWGLQAEILKSTASSYIFTAATTATRAADLFQAPFPHNPQEMTLYTRFPEIGGGLTPSNVRAWAITSLAGGNPQIRLFGNKNSGYGVTHANGVSTATSNAQAVGPFGDLVECRVVLFGDGSVLYGEARNGGAEALGVRSGALALAPAWADRLLFINSGGNSLESRNKFLALKAHRGVRTLDFMRAL